MIKNNGRSKSFRVLGFDSFDQFEFVLRDESGEIFSFPFPVAKFRRDTQTESRAKANAALVFSVILSPTSPQAIKQATECLSVALTQEQARAWVERLAGIAQANALNDPEKFLIVRLRRRKKWLMVDRSVGCGIFEVYNTKAATVTGRAMVKADDAMLRRVAVSDNPRLGY